MEIDTQKYSKRTEELTIWFLDLHYHKGSNVFVGIAMDGRTTPFDLWDWDLQIGS